MSYLCNILRLPIWKLNPEGLCSKVGVESGFAFGSTDAEIKVHSIALGSLPTCGLSDGISSVLPHLPALGAPWVFLHLFSDGLHLEYQLPGSVYLLEPGLSGTGSPWAAGRLFPPFYRWAC